jgi:predicted glycosyltransferase
MKKILFYCQYLAGMGHLVRSTEIIRSLIQEFQVCFVNGGQLVPGFELPEAVEVIQLPELVEVDGQLQSLDSQQSLAEIQQQRVEQLLQVFDQFQPDCIITECFPFSKHKLKFELLPLLEYAKAAQYPVKVVCSLRDLIMTQSRSSKAQFKRYETVCDWVNRYYDLVLVHADAQVQRLDEFFPKIHDLTCPVVYTGYVAQMVQSAEATRGESSPLQAPTIVASAGGGRFGYPLLQAVILAARVLQSLPHHFYLFGGPFMNSTEFNLLATTSMSLPNVTVSRFTPYLIDEMQRADLSISLGGYNTTMNILRTGVRALVFPFAAQEQAEEQSIRALMLEQKQILDVLHPEDLTSEHMAAKIEQALQKSPRSHAFNLQGAQQTTLHLQTLLTDAVARTRDSLPTLLSL